MKPVDPAYLIIGAVILVLIVKGILIRAGEWSGADWLWFLLALSACACLAAVPFVIPQQVQNHGWPPAARIAYFVTELLLMLYGVFEGVALLRAFAGIAPPPHLVNATALAFGALTVAFGVAAWLQFAAGISFQQSGAVILGIFSVWVGASLPEWVKGLLSYRVLSSLISETGTRLASVAVGLVLIGFGLAGRAHIFR